MSLRFSTLLLDFHSKGATGLLRLRCEGKVKQIYLKNGNPIFVESNTREESLGEMLVRMGRITQEELAEVLQHMIDKNIRQGEALVDLGMMDGLEVVRLLEMQIKEKLYRCVLMDDFEYDFASGEEEIEGVMAFNLNPYEIIFEGIKKFFDVAAVRRVWSVRPEDVYIIKPEAKRILERISLNARELHVVRNLSGNLTIRDILEKHKDNSKEVFVFIYALYEMGLLHMPPSKAGVKNDKKDKVEHKETVVKKKKAESVDSEIYRIYLKVSYKNYFEILDIPPSAGSIEIKSAYIKKIYDLKLHEPEKHYKGESLEKAREVFDRLTLAYTVLTDNDKRKRYLKSLSLGGGVKEDEKLLAEVEAKKAELFMARKEYKRALSFFEKACEIDSETAFYFAGAAKCRLHILGSLLKKGTKSEEDEKRIEKLRKSLESDIDKALKIDRKCPEALVVASDYARLEGDFEKAIKMLNRAIEASPDKKNLLTKLRILENEQKKSKKKGLFGLKIK